MENGHPMTPLRYWNDENMLFLLLLKLKEKTWNLKFWIPIYFKCLRLFFWHLVKTNKHKKVQIFKGYFTLGFIWLNCKVTCQTCVHFHLERPNKLRCPLPAVAFCLLFRIRTRIDLSRFFSVISLAGLNNQRHKLSFESGGAVPA